MMTKNFGCCCPGQLVTCVCVSHSPVRPIPVREGSDRKHNVCLVDTLRSLGRKVPYDRDGPFWALADGNTMLRPFGSLG